MRPTDRCDVGRHRVEGPTEPVVPDADGHVGNDRIGKARKVVAERDAALLLELGKEGDGVMHVPVPRYILPAHDECVGRRERLPETAR